MHWRTKGLFALIPMLLLLVGIPILAQQNTGSITGKVLDDQSQPIPGATVTATSPNLQGPRGTATNMDGDFVLPYLPPAANYTLTVESAGYNKVVQSGIAVKLGSTTTLNFSLSKGSSQVVVTAKPPAVSLKDTKLETNLTSDEMDTIPISRGYQDIMYLAPTVVSSGMGGNPGVAGSTGSQNIWVINGVNTTDPVTGTFATNLNYNFIREIEVNTGGLSAEYGASTGGLFNVLTISGSNEFHGEAFAYYTDQSMSAQGAPVAAGGLTRTDYHSYDYGFDLGGPILKDKLWYFVGYNPSLHSTHYEGVNKTLYYGAIPVPSSYTKPDQGYPVPYNFDDLSRNWFWSSKFNYRINDKHNLEFAAFGDPSHMWYNEGMYVTTD
ncbi:MAG: TonB-dependent receptor, partial [Acidobacteriota bacterium]